MKFETEVGSRLTSLAADIASFTEIVTFVLIRYVKREEVFQSLIFWVNALLIEGLNSISLKNQDLQNGKES